MSNKCFKDVDTSKHHATTKERVQELTKPLRSSTYASTFSCRSKRVHVHLALLCCVSIVIISWYHTFVLPRYEPFHLSTDRTTFSEPYTSHREIQRIVDLFWKAVNDRKRTSSSTMTKPRLPYVRRMEQGCMTVFYEKTDIKKESSLPKTAGRRYQCVGVPGRLGNAMFAYASSLGVAALSNRTMVVASSNPLLSHFKLRALVPCNTDASSNSSSRRSSSNSSASHRNSGINDNRLCRRPRVQLDHGCCTFSSAILEPDTKSVYLKAGPYLQSWRYFHHVEQELRQQFTVYGPTADYSDDAIRNIRHSFESNHQTVTLVGLHVRYGDLVTRRFQVFGYALPPVGYYRRAMEWYVRKFSRVVFVVSSDDRDYVDKHILPLCIDLKQRTHLLRTHSNIEEYKNTNLSTESGHKDAQNVASKHLTKVKQNNNLRNVSKQPLSFPQLLATNLENRLNESNIVKDLNRESNFQKTSSALRSDLSWMRRRPPWKNHSMTSVKTESPEKEDPGVVSCLYVGSLNPALDMAVLGKCDHLIMSVGTFGWWAGWLTQGTVVYYKHPAQPGSRYAQVFNAADFFPPTWIPME